MRLLIQLIFIFILQVTNIKAQGTCSNACPPLNAGRPVEAVCPGDNLSNSSVNTTKSYKICYPKQRSLKLQDLKGYVTIIANYYVGCEAGLRESSVFAHIAQTYYNKYGNRTIFIQSIKGGGTCSQWADIYINDTISLFNEIPKDMPWTINDVNYEIRDDLFTEPFKHPSYVILDGDLNVRYKFIGPCCGYSTYSACSDDVVLGLEGILSGYIDGILDETTGEVTVPIIDEESSECIAGNWSDWSPCPLTCGSSPLNNQFRYRNITGNCTDTPIETKPCANIRQCLNQTKCLPQFGSSYVIQTITSGLNQPKDVKFHPTPGLHLSNYSEGRVFHASDEEAWVVNSGNHSISIITGINTPYRTTISRRDRGYYHYMINGTAISFNAIKDSNRSKDRDSFNYWAICNNNNNTYLNTKEANYFMGPTLYNSNPDNHNLVNKLGDICSSNEECYFLHTDMLHESPSCIGITHDPEILSAYGNVYWVFDSVGNRENGQLVRFDFQQPHGPGSMDHSVASVRRFVEVKLKTGENVHAGMVIHPHRRELYISNPGDDNILVVKVDSGTFSRFARQEYPIYSNRLPSFEYSIYECVDQAIFAQNIKTPTGLALSDTHLFVAEHHTGKIKVYEVETGVEIHEIATGFTSIGGMTFSPIHNMLYFVDEKTNTLNRIKPMQECNESIPTTINPDYIKVLKEAQSHNSDFSSTFDYSCKVNPIIPDSSYFDQVHTDSGYADSNPDVQSPQAAMDANAALLANRTDCGYDSELNFDALLLGGYFCHVCLPEQDLACDYGGVCSNVQWRGYICDNEFKLSFDDDNVSLQTMNGTDLKEVELKPGIIYRFIVDGDEEVCLTATSSNQETDKVCASNGPLLHHVNNSTSKVQFSTKTKPLFDLAVQTQTITPKQNKTSILDTILNSSSAISKTITESYSSSNLSPHSTLGIVLGIIIFVIFIPISYYMLPMFCPRCDHKPVVSETNVSIGRYGTVDKNGSIGKNGTVDRISSKEIVVEDGEKNNLSLSVKIEEYC